MVAVRWWTGRQTNDVVGNTVSIRRNISSTGKEKQENGAKGPTTVALDEKEERQALDRQTS